MVTNAADQPSLSVQLRSTSETGLFEKDANALMCEFVAVLRMNGFRFREIKIKIRFRDVYALIARALQVHLDVP
jgi:hypothetical protein